MTERKSQTQPLPHDEFYQDLHPDMNEGINDANVSANTERDAPNAYDIKEIHTLLPDFTDDELRRIVVLQQGDRLKQGATYFDLRHGDRGEFTADTPEEVGPPNLHLFIPKSEVDYVLWNRIIGVQNPERLDQANDSSVR